MGAIANDWLEPLKPEFAKPYYAQLYKKVKEEYTTHQIFPPSDMIFHAFEVTPLEDVKVVILGQDPYHGDGQAHGLCFSVQPQVAIPPSLENIYKELQDDLGCYIPNNGYLEKWAKQGVLLLNTVLTVRAHQANSHRGIGWEQFTDASGTAEESHAEQSASSDTGSTASKPSFGLQRIFRQQTIQSDKQVSGGAWCSTY